MNRKLNKNTTPKREKAGSPIDEAMHYLGFRARTVREVERHLDECNYGEVEIMEAVQRLQELNLLNDEAFAADFISTRLASKPISRGHLKEQLLGHEIPKEIIEVALQAVTTEQERENALAVAQKYLRQFEGMEQEQRRDRVTKRILARGFGFDDARSALETALQQEAEEADA